MDKVCVVTVAVAVSVLLQPLLWEKIIISF